MALFVLVHGAWHGAWCWEKVIPELEARGHTAVAMDMPIDEESAGWDEYADAVTASIGDTTDDVVLVGHSMGGFVIPVVAERRPVSRCVFLAAALPVDESFFALLASNPQMFELGFDTLVANEDGSTSWRREDAIDAFYADVPRSEAEAAYERLRPQFMSRGGDSFPITSFPNAPSTYIVCSQDRAVSADWGRQTAASVGMDLVEMDSSHSPFLSKPSELADILSLSS
jgi:pimeloyl-ACP methyl ester carboxylesterase